jgi:hypothetical protein
MQVSFKGKFSKFFGELSEREQAFAISLMKGSKWCFLVLKLLVESEQGVFSRASLFKRVLNSNINARNKRVFDSFISRLLREGLVVQGETRVTCRGKEIPLFVTVSGRNVFRAVFWWNEIVKQQLRKEVWSK